MVRVKLFGLLRLDSGISELELEADRVRDIYPQLLAELRRRSQECSLGMKELKACIISVNDKRVSDAARLEPGDIVYLLPPVAGG